MGWGDCADCDGYSVLVFVWGGHAGYEWKSVSTWPGEEG